MAEFFDAHGKSMGNLFLSEEQMGGEVRGTIYIEKISFVLNSLTSSCYEGPGRVEPKNMEVVLD